jgi:GNAT superfamily N-acetyltransferase
MPHLELSRGEFMLSSDPSRLDIGAMHEFLSQSYWGRQRPRSVLERAVRHSLCQGLYRGGAQIGFGRAVTDYATFGYLADVYVLEAYRGRGLGKWLVASILEHPDLGGLRRWMLATKTAHKLYHHFEFTALKEPGNFMELVRPYPASTETRATTPQAR